MTAALLTGLTREEAAMLMNGASRLKVGDAIGTRCEKDGDGVGFTFTTQQKLIGAFVEKHHLYLSGGAYRWSDEAMEFVTAVQP